MEEKSFEEYLQEEDFNELKKGKVFEGNIASISGDGVWVALPATGDVFVKREELIKNISEYKPGETITVTVTKTNDAEGMNDASEKMAVADKIKEELKEEQIVKAKFVARVKKGYIVTIQNAVRAFLPGSLSNLKPNDDMPKEEKKMKVISLSRGRVVLSRRDAVEDILKNSYENFKENMIVEGTVESIKDFGAFIKIDENVNALVPRSEITWEKNFETEKVLKIGEKVKGVIIKLDKENKKISVSIKQLKDDPWNSIEEKYPVGTILKGKVMKIFPFGFTVKIDTGIEGLVHESEIFWNRKGKISDVVSEGENVEVKVLGIDKEKKRLSLSYREALGNPWEGIEERYYEGNIVTGIVEKVLPNGAIIKLEEGLTGFVHVSELSWNFIDNVEEALKEEQKIKVKILNIDKESQRIKLSIKQANENPWKKVSEELKEGDNVSGTVARYAGSGAVVVLDGYEVEAFLPIKNVSREKINDLSEVMKIGDKTEAKIIKIEFENEDKKGNMIISINALNEEKERAELEETLKKINEEQ